MRAQYRLGIVIAVLIIGLVVGLGVGALLFRVPATPTTTTVTVTVPKTVTVTVTASPTPTPTEKVRIAVIYVTPIEEPWNMALHQAMKWAEKHLNIEYVYTEKVHEADVERVMREYINLGYKVIFPHSWGYHPVTIRLAKEFPDVLFCQGSGPVDIEWPNNVLLYDYWIQEAAYLAGMVAGLMTKTNVIGVVTAFAVPDVNRLVNAFCAGAKAVNPDVKIIVTFIESWFDPVKAKEAAAAQIEAGADFIYAERYGVFEACREAQKKGKRVYAFGNIVNQNDLAPDVVIASVVWDLRPFIKYVVDMVRRGEIKGGIVDWGMKEGWAKFVWNEKLKEKIVPPEVVKKIEEAKKAIIEGKLKVPIYEDWDPERWK
ncbi:MAG TPA: BMP family ABC transporter substrate-binding protein [Desulfurococcales archaeon]|nr:BMP family ABC transporter substrate-binding protein [Desulfurococcales archaeon]